MSILIKGMEMPTCCGLCPLIDYETLECRGGGIRDKNCYSGIYYGCPLVPVPTPHGRLIDVDALRAKMYHEAFEIDTPMQKWDSGCWIRYKMFERMEEDAPTIIPAEEGET